MVWNSVSRDEFQTITAASPVVELLEWHAGVEPISHARSRRTVQVAQHDHRLARLRIHAKNRVHSRSAAAVAVAVAVILWVGSSPYRQDLFTLAAVYALASWVSGEGTTERARSRMRGIMVWRRDSRGAWRLAQELLHSDPDDTQSD